MTSQVPKIIWQTHEWDYSDLPEHLKKVTMTWRNLNPTWEYRYASGKERGEYVKSKDSLYPCLYLFYCAADKATQADLWRYLVIYDNGGVYADMDSVCTEPLDQSFKDIGWDIEVISEQPDHNGQINNSNFAAIKSSEVIQQILRTIVEERYGPASLFSVLQLIDRGLSWEDAVKFQVAIGPQYFTAAIKNNIDLVWQDYKGFIHSSDIWDSQSNLISTLEVDYYGEKKRYLDLARDNNWSLV